MVTIYDMQAQMEQLDLQLLSLLQDRSKLYLQSHREDEDLLDDADILAMWIEEAGERGLDEALTERLCKLTILLSRRGQE